MITAVGVVVPARDEAERLSGCLRSVERALSALPGGISTAIWVVADRCRDATPDIAERLLGRRAGRGWESSEDPLPVGSLRARGVRAVLQLLSGHDPERIWLLNTDADTVVPANWARAHISHAGRGADAVAGLADLAGDSELHPVAAARYAEISSRHRHAGGHGHVYGANLGVRAARYLEVGGFAARSCGEDVDLVERLRRAGAAVLSPLDVRVTTSARTVGRATGGVADLLAALQWAATGSHQSRSPIPAA